MLDNDFGRSSKDRSLKTDTNIAVSVEEAGSSRNVCSIRIIFAGVKDPEELQRTCHRIDLNCRLVSDPIVMKAVVIQKKLSDSVYL